MKHDELTSEHRRLHDDLMQAKASGDRQAVLAANGALTQFSSYWNAVGVMCGTLPDKLTTVIYRN